MAQMLLIRCILGVRSFRSMIFMGNLWVELDKIAEYYVNVCIIGGYLELLYFWVFKVLTIRSCARHEIRDNLYEATFSFHNCNIHLPK